MSLPFPLAWRWTISVAAAEGSAPDPIRSASAIAQALIAEKATSVIRAASEIKFECKGLGGMSRYALLAPISGGSVDVQSSGDCMRITYTLEFMLAFWVSIIFSFLFWYIGPHHQVSFETLVPFCWLYGGNVVITLWRFPRFIRFVVMPPNQSFKRDALKKRAP